MSETTDIVRRVVSSLTADEGDETALLRYLNHDRDVLVDSIVETLQARGDNARATNLGERMAGQVQLLAELMAESRSFEDLVERTAAAHLRAPRGAELRPLARRAMIRAESNFGGSWFDGPMNRFMRIEDL